MNRSDLTPAMRQAVALTQPGQDMRGLFFASTINGLVRHGLARRDRGWGVDDHVFVLTPAGLEMRDALRARVDSLLAEKGYLKAVTGSLVLDPEEEGKLITRGAAMKRLGVKW